MPPSLFSSDPHRPATALIAGLRYLPAFLHPEEARSLLQSIDAAPWLDDLKRRVQHYGYKYDYRRRSIDYSMRLGELPEWAAPLAERFVAEGIMPWRPDQLIVNEYQPGQGIANHVDCKPCFDDTIVSMSLGSGCVMNFTRLADRKEIIPLRLLPRSVVVLTGPARYEWMHGIKSIKNDKWEGHRIPRLRRVSLTFRKTILASA
ncbi:MAG: alpha-ketoglutarate-dependent dioxygenase AlkB [Bacteroidota bacterium]